MLKIVLFSDSKRVYEITKKIVEGKYALAWCTYSLLKDNKYPLSNIAIMHYDGKMLEKDICESIIKVKGRLGHNLPVLALIEGGSPQDIFIALEAGAYDYLEDVENIQEYKKKIEDMVSWDWYMNKYGPGVRQQ